MASKARKKLNSAKFDEAVFLRSDKEIVTYLQACLEEAGDDPRIIAHALGLIARARGGIAKVAKDAGLTREGLHKALGKDGNPSLGTFLKVTRAIGVKIVAKAA